MSALLADRGRLWHAYWLMKGTASVFRFGGFELDEAAYELRREGQRLHLARQPMDLLLLLVGRPRELVSRDEIVASLWREQPFGDLDAGIHTAMMKIRQTLGDTGRNSRFVETVPGKGYRFVAIVEILRSAIASSAPERVTAPEPPVGRRQHLPVDLTSFIGRGKELDELPRLLAASRLLSLVGAGGVGKTRLAVRLATDLVSDFPDGVWMADLGALAAADLVAQTIAGAVGLREGSRRTARAALLEYLRERRALLLLDTCEHVVAACAELVDALLRQAPHLRIVATSREALAVPGEVVYRVPSLSVPEEPVSLDALRESEAGRLFIERATATDPTFRPTPADGEAIASICRRLDGIPLAIELAAARVPMLSPEQIEIRLQDRFRLLTGGSRTAVARQRTLAATVDWSYRLLSDLERLLLNRLSVFPASWTLEAAEQVCSGEPIHTSDTLQLLSRLVDKSLVVLDRDSARRQRYRLLDTVRDYAGARLAEDGATAHMCERHFAFFFERFRDSQRILRGPNQLPRLAEIRLEQENVRAALNWAFGSEMSAEDGVELASAVFWYWTKCGSFEEGKLWLQRAVAIGAPPDTRARALYGLAHMHHFQGDQARVAAFGAEMAFLGRDGRDTWAVSAGLFLQALAAFELGVLDQAHARAIAARAAADLCGETVEHGGPLMILANVELVRGNPDVALRLYDESIDVHRRAGDIWGLSILLSIAAGLRIVRDDFEGARVQGAEALSLSQALGDPRGIAWSLEVFAGLLAAEGSHDCAARLWGLSDALLEISGGALTATIGWIRERYIERVRDSMGAASFASTRVDGRRMSVDDGVALIGPPQEPLHITRSTPLGAHSSDRGATLSRG